MSNRMGRNIIMSSFCSCFLFFSVLMYSSWPHTGSMWIPPTATIYPPSLANARWRNFAQQELDSCWVLFLTDKGPYMRCGSSALAHLHICSTRHADYLLPSLACKSKSKDFRPMRGARLLHGAYFECERAWMCCYCTTFVPWDVCLTRHPDFSFQHCLPHGMLAI